MNDPFTDVADELMMRSTDLTADDAPPPPVPSGAKTKKHVCPYCGAVTAVVEKPTGPCPRCNMEDTPATRAATKARIGPWYVLQTRNPSAPGMKWATLLSLVSKGQVTPRSVVRGPTTHQLWKFAAHVKGLSREFNLCYSCGGEVERTANQCPHCDRLQEPPVNPDTLLESREMAARGPIQREIKPLPSAPPTDLVLAGGHGEELARKRSPDDGILSAKELAAAFQLDFNPQAPAAIAPPNTVQRRRRPLRALATLMLLAAIGGGAVLYAKPEYREKTVAWVNSTIGSIRTSIAPAKPAPKAMPWDNSTAQKTTEEPAPAPIAESVPAPTPTPAPVVEAPTETAPPAPTPAAEQIVTTPAPAPTVPEATANASSNPVAVTEAPQPAPAPAPVVVQDPTPTPPPIVHETPAATPVSQARQSQEKLLSDLDAPIPTSISAQTELGKRLFEGALDAERSPTLDFTLAARCYEKIQKLDAVARPLNAKALNQRLEFARTNIPKN